MALHGFASTAQHSQDSIGVLVSHRAERMEGVHGGLAVRALLCNRRQPRRQCAERVAAALPKLMHALRHRQARTSMGMQSSVELTGRAHTRACVRVCVCERGVPRGHMNGPKARMSG